jgi:hypothetical protein
MTLYEEIENLRRVLSYFDPFNLLGMGMCAGAILAFLIAFITFPWNGCR